MKKGFDFIRIKSIKAQKIYFMSKFGSWTWKYTIVFDTCVNELKDGKDNAGIYTTLEHSISRANSEKSEALSGMIVDFAQFIIREMKGE